MILPEDVRALSRDGLLALMASLRDEVARLERQLAEATATIEELRKENAELRRSRKRQAAPFSKGTRATNPKRPGRKPGMGSLSYRKPPPPEQVTEPPVDVAVTAETCPGCGGKLQHERVELAYTTDVPPVPRLW